MLYEQEKEFSVTEAMQNIQEVNNDKSKHFKDSTMELPHYYLTHLKDWEKRFWLFGQIRSLENEYRLDHFAFDFDEFCQFVNSTGLDFSPVKEDGTNHFDFSLYYDYRLIAQSREIDWMRERKGEYLRNIPYEAFGSAQTFLETEVGQKEFPSLRDTVDQDLAKEKKIYTQENYERLIGLVEKMRNSRDYTFEHFVKHFIPVEDQEIFASLVKWLRKRDKKYFKDSIDRYLIYVKSDEREKQWVIEHIDEIPSSILKNWGKLDNYLYTYYQIKSQSVRLELVHYGLEEYQRRFNRESLEVVKDLEKKKQNDDDPFEGIENLQDKLAYYLECIQCAKKQLPEEQKAELDLIISWLISFKKNKESLLSTVSTMKKELVDTKQALLLISTFLRLADSLTGIQEFYDYAEKRFSISREKQRRLIKKFLQKENDSELNEVYRLARTKMKELQYAKQRESQKIRFQERKEKLINEFGEKAIAVMSQFVEADEDTITKFCSHTDIERNEFDFLRKLCRQVDVEISELVDQKTRLAAVKFLHNMRRIVCEVSADIVKCNREKVPYDVFKHFETYGYDPSLIAQIAGRLGNLSNEKQIIVNYMAKNKELFKPLSNTEITTMERSSLGLIGGRICLKDQMINFNVNEFQQALNILNEKNIPITKGTLFVSLKQVKNKQNQNGFQKRIRPKI